MLLEVVGLSKKIGGKNIIDNISFSVGAGDVVGILGLNGSGKTTILKSIAGYYNVNKGKVFVGGYDMSLFESSVKPMLGYLPEGNPLYYNMYIIEYLSFIAKIYKISKNEIASRVSELVKLFALEPVIGKKISALSKGYKQRVGIAQLLIHKPKVILLDEPISGLDIVQIKHLSKIIKTISKDTAVLISSHILKEVEELCSHFIVLKQGSIVWKGKNNIGEGSKRKIILETKNPLPSDIFADFNFITDFKKKDPSQSQNIYESLIVWGNDNDDYKGLIFDALIKKGVEIREIRYEKCLIGDVLREELSS